MRYSLTALALILIAACGSTAPEPITTPGPSVPDKQIEPDQIVPDLKPEFLERVEALVRALCECGEPECFETGYVTFRDGVDGRNLEGWRATRIRELHVMRVRGEDCNLSMLTGGDEALLELAREAFLDRFAARAPVLLTQLYDAAVSRHAANQPLPDSSESTPKKASCCNWSDGLCPENAQLWTVSPWSDLGFAVTETQAFSYEFSRAGNVVTVRAFGDLDCDGDLSLYELRGDVSSEPHPKIRINKRLE